LRWRGETRGQAQGDPDDCDAGPHRDPEPDSARDRGADPPSGHEERAGQEAFATYVVEAWAYALATNDGSLLTDVSAGRKPCQGCKELETELAQRTKDGWSVYPFDVTIDKIKLVRSRLGTTARVRFDVPETRSFFDDGSLRNTSPAHVGATFTVSLRLEKKEYQLLGFAIS